MIHGLKESSLTFILTNSNRILNIIELKGNIFAMRHKNFMHYYIFQ